MFESILPHDLLAANFPMTMHRNLVPFFGLLAGLAFADEAAHVVGPIDDGTPSPPSAPLPKLDIATEDVLEAKVRELDGRKITVQKVSPIDLPPMPELPAPAEPTAEQIGRWEAAKLQHKDSVLLLMAVTVYHLESYPGKLRTQIRWWPTDRNRECEVWSSIDGNWLGGFASFAAGNKEYSLLLGAGNVDVDQVAAAMAQRGAAYTPPEIPEIAAGQSAFVVTKGNPTAEELAPIEAIHELVRNDCDKLRLAFEGREKARLEQEALLKANPPKPQDIVIRYWKIEKPAGTTSQEGGSH